MKRYPAIALLEFRDVAVGMYATDAVVKKAPIAALKCGTISRGRYLTMFGGTTASVHEAYEEGHLYGGESIIDHVFLPDVHPAVHDGILGRRADGPWSGAVGIIETYTVSSNVRAAERAMKSTPVDLVELRLSDSWLAGKGISLYHGALHDVQAAMELALGDLADRHIEHVHRLITAPHEALTQLIGESTHFVATQLLDLEGEVLPEDTGESWKAAPAAKQKRGASARTRRKKAPAPRRAAAKKKTRKKPARGKKKRR